MHHAFTAESSHQPFEKMGMHRHAKSYAAVVLDGSYEEHGPDGRFRCEVGSLIVHPPWHQHGDEFGRGGAVILNLPVQSADGLYCARVSDIEAVAKIAHQSPQLAGCAALEEAQECEPLAPAAWLETLAMMLVTEQYGSIAEMAVQCGVSHEHASRACKRWFGMSPTELRRESRLQMAIDLLENGATPAEAAADAGFSDQPHLTRILKRATGRTPANFKRTDQIRSRHSH